VHLDLLLHAFLSEVVEVHEATDDCEVRLSICLLVKFNGQSKQLTSRVQKGAEQYQNTNEEKITDRFDQFLLFTGVKVTEAISGCWVEHKDSNGELTDF
jgi:hypothetical protein